MAIMGRLEQRYSVYIRASLKGLFHNLCCYRDNQSMSISVAGAPLQSYLGSSSI